MLLIVLKFVDYILLCFFIAEMNAILSVPHEFAFDAARPRPAFHERFATAFSTVERLAPNFYRWEDVQKHNSVQPALVRDC
jgi:hypothetical protein